MSTYTSDSGSVDSEIDAGPPMRLCARPPQFPTGKTATTLAEMERMMSWFMDAGQQYNDTFPAERFDRIVHLIFVNNNLIEGDQWKDRMVRRGIQTMKIFSSKSDVRDTATLYKLITEGEYDAVTDEYTPITYVLMCTNTVRLQNICQEDTGDSILRRLERFHPNIGIVPWFDEIDKFVKLHIEYIPIFKQFGNVPVLNGITATPYSKFWKIMHECGYTDIPLIGELPDAKDYRSMKDHTLLYSDLIQEKSPVKHFKWLLEHPGELMYTEKCVRHMIPNLTDNAKRILFVPGESACKTHIAIKDLALKFRKNTLIINGKQKGFYKYSAADPEGEFLSVQDYKKTKVLEKVVINGQSIADMTIMDIAIVMYNDTRLDLKSADLVITGFHCVERGVTFNRPNFQFTHGIFSSYHYKESSDLIESIIQIAGRCFGNKDWVPAGITIISPKYITDTVERAIENIIEFLRTKPTSIQYADVYRERNGIPILIQFNDKTVLEKLVEIRKLGKKDRDYVQALLKGALASGGITLTDPNHIDEKRRPFSFEHYMVAGKRILEPEHNVKNYRFDKFYENYSLGKCYGQTVKEKGQYVLDLTMVDYKISDEITLTPGMGFISFVYKPK